MASRVLLIGCGRLGSAVLAGWRATGAVAMTDLAILTPSSKPAADAAAREGARINPDDLSGVETAVLAVKPAYWRAMANTVSLRLAPDCVLLSLMAGVRASDIAGGFGGRAVARIMPTTAVAAGRGAAAIWSDAPAARAEAHRLFDPIARTADVRDEGLIDVATAMSGSGAAYVYAFVRALTRAGRAQGLGEEQARVLAEATASGALAWLEESGQDIEALIAQVASPGGTTQAGLEVLQPALDDLVGETVAAALRRARELSSS